MPDDQLHSLSEPFFRPDSARTRSAGVGLGLTLCRLVAQAHGGTLEISNARPGLRWSRCLLSWLPGSSWLVLRVVSRLTFLRLLACFLVRVAVSRLAHPCSGAERSTATPTRSDPTARQTDR